MFSIFWVLPAPLSDLRKIFLRTLTLLQSQVLGIPSNQDFQRNLPNWPDPLSYPHMVRRSKQARKRKYDVLCFIITKWDWLRFQKMIF